VTQTTDRARRVVAELFDAYRADPAQLPPDFRDTPDPARAVADYVAGMTDRFALREHHRLTGRRLFEPGADAGPAPGRDALDARESG
jgi:dGTPase